MSPWPRRALVAAISLAFTGCATQLHTVDPGWDGSTPPDCTDDDGAVVVDSLAADAAFHVASDSKSGLLGLLGLVAGVGFTASAVTGEHRVHECRRAKAAWETGQAVAANLRDDEADRRDLPADRPPPPPPRGFYCATSASHARDSVCAREAVDCDHARDDAAVARADFSTCTLTERAWCFEARCYASRAACAAHRGPDSVGECREQR